MLYTFEVDRRVKQAMIVHRGRHMSGGTGWYVESWARCDWAELPAALADELGIEVWVDPSGRRVPTTRVVSGLGPKHCDWQDSTFLHLDDGELDGGQTYVEHGDPGNLPDHLAVPYVRDAELPTDARDTGYERDGTHLWVAADQSRAFIGTRESVAVWPRTVQPLVCA